MKRTRSNPLATIIFGWTFIGAVIGLMAGLNWIVNHNRTLGELVIGFLLFVLTTFLLWVIGS